MHNDVILQAASRFSELGVMDEIVNVLRDDLKWELPYDIQEEAIPKVLGGCDVVAVTTPFSS